MTTKFDVRDTVYFEYCGKIIKDTVREIRIFKDDEYPSLDINIEYILRKNDFLGFVPEENLFSTFEDCRQAMLEVARIEVQRIESLMEEQ